MVSIPACHAGNPGSIPGLGVFFRWVGKILRKRQWCIGNIEASQALAPGSTPGWRTIFWQVWKNNDPQRESNPQSSGLESDALPLRHGVISYRSARGLVVMIVACQVMDPGSIPGERKIFLF